MITEEMLIAEIKRLALLYPNAKYRSRTGMCKYDEGKVKNGPETEGCIFGQAIRNLDPDIFEKYGGMSCSILKLCNNHIGINTENLKLGDVQYAQDQGKAWGEAIKELRE